MDGAGVSAAHVRRRWWVLVPALALAAPVVRVLLTDFAGIERGMQVLLCAAAVIPIAVGLHLLRAWPTVDREATLHVDDTGVRLGDRVLVARADVVGAVVVPMQAGFPAVVRLSRRLAPPIDLGVPSIEDARSIVRALGFDPLVEPMRVRVRAISAAPVLSTLMRATLAVLGPTLGVIAFATHFWVAVVLGVAVLGALRLIPSSIEVADDGVLLRYDVRRAFIPGAELVGIDVERDPSSNDEPPKTLRVILRRKGSLPDVAVEVDTARAESLAERLRALVHARREPLPAAPLDRALLARGGRATREWVRALRAIAGRAGSFRSEGAPVEALWRVLEDARTPASDRAAAAIALRAAVDDEGRKRLTRIAEHSAAPHLRIAATVNDDEELAAALETLERDELDQRA